MSDPVTEVVRRVYESPGCFIEVGPDRDGLGCVEVRVTNEQSEKYWGPVRLTMNKEFALKLAEAIKDGAWEIEP